ncbi:MAG: dihydrolipoamide succinyltransferase, partial [Lysobacterales bacterium]
MVLVDVKVPILAESIPDATLLDWRKRPGDAVARDEILLELETDKVVLEVPAPQAGVLSEVLKNTGDIALSQEVLARIDTEASAPAGAADTAVVSTKAPEAAPAPVSSIALSPAVQHLVAEHDLDPSAITGTGKDGRLIKGDVLAFLDANKAQKPSTAPAAPAPVVSKPAVTPTPVRGDGGERREPLSRLRMRIAERLVQAQQTAAILTTFNEVNMQPVMELRKRYKEQFEKTHGVRLGFMSFFAKAAVQALERFPAVNAYIEGNEIVYHDYQDIG